MNYILKNHYLRTYVIHPPWYVNMICPVIKIFLSESMIEKIEFLGKDWKEKLLEEVFVNKLMIKNLIGGCRKFT